MNAMKPPQKKPPSGTQFESLSDVGQPVGWEFKEVYPDMNFMKPPQKQPSSRTQILRFPLNTLNLDSMVLFISVLTDEKTTVMENFEVQECLLSKEKDNTCVA